MSFLNQEVKKARVFFQLGLSKHLTYRPIILIWALIEIVSLSAVIFLWLAVYRQQTQVGAYSGKEMIFYYAFLPLIGSFTAVFLTSFLPQKIKDGRLSPLLLRPYSLPKALFLNSLSSLLIRQVFKLPLFIIFFSLLFFFFHFKILWFYLFLSLFFCFFAWFLNFILDFCLSLTAFWINDVWSLEHFKFILTMIFGGLAFPLDILPLAWQKVFYFLPFQFFYFFPLRLAQAKLSFVQIRSGLICLFFWLCFFVLTAFVLWRRGLKKFGAFGG